MTQENASPNKRTARRLGCLGWMVKIGLGFVVLVVLLAPVGSVYQYLAEQRDHQRYPPPGKLVDVGGFRMHLFCTGSGSPTVVMEAGLGDASFTWELVQGAVAQQTRVCSYDRPGLGWSDFVDRVMLRDEMARNLHTLLQNAGEPGPYLLVGHSAGGIYVRAFAQLYPHEMAGMVLVDSSHESQLLRYDQAMGMGNNGGSLDSLLRICDIVAPTGILRLTGVTALTFSDSPLPEATKASAVAGMNRNTFCRTIENEMKSTDIDMSQQDGPQPLGDLPLIVLTAGQGFGPSTDQAQSGRPAGTLRRGEQIWRQMQSDLVALSTHSKQVIAEHSSHYIHWDQPDLVISAIQELVTEYR